MLKMMFYNMKSITFVLCFSWYLDLRLTNNEDWLS
jgi:hypothetical protein